MQILLLWIWIIILHLFLGILIERLFLSFIHFVHHFFHVIHTNFQGLDLLIGLFQLQLKVLNFFFIVSYYGQVFINDFFVLFKLGLEGFDFVFLRVDYSLGLFFRLLKFILHFFNLGGFYFHLVLILHDAFFILCLYFALRFSKFRY